MTTEITFTIKQIEEKINQYKKTLCDNKNHELYCTDLQLNTEIFDNFIEWLKPEPKYLGWVGYDSNNSLFFRENPTASVKNTYNMREVMFKPEDTK